MNTYKDYCAECAEAIGMMQRNAVSTMFEVNGERYVGAIFAKVEASNELSLFTKNAIDEHIGIINECIHRHNDNKDVVEQAKYSRDNKLNVLYIKNKLRKIDNLPEVLELHEKCTLNEEGGVRADLSWADLRDADLTHADLRGASLRYADLSHSDLSYANLRVANLFGANFRDASLYRANLSGANLKDADLSCADLRLSDFSHADLKGIILEGTILDD